jgi:exopolysaccharide biosynthesis polyprenyl glycosylphosphotransferase
MQNSLLGVYHPAHKVTLLICDLLGILLSFYIAAKVRLDTSPDFLSIEYLGLNAVIVASLFIGNGYTSRGLGGKPRLPFKALFTVLVSALPGTLFIYLSGPEKFTALFGRGVFPVAIILFGLLALVIRMACSYLFKVDECPKKIAVIGNIKVQDSLEKSIANSNQKFDLQYSSTLSHIEADIDAIVMMPDHSPNKIEQQLLINARLTGIPIFSLSDFFENTLYLVPVNEINNDWFIRTEGFIMLHSSVNIRIKRVIDIVGALLLIVAAIPLGLATAAAIKASSRGPVFFSQTRVGVKGTHFILHKFRTMKEDAEQDGAQWAQENDSRVLAIGHFLRRSRIDELPQCWNILKGDMSIVGPRPERPQFTSELSIKIPYYELRHIIKPGLTGWAQVSYPYGASIEDSLRKLQYDLYYIKNYSLLLDLNIFLRTILVTIRRSGR